METLGDYAVDFVCHDEVVLMQTFDFLCLQGNRRIAPAELYVRMMAFTPCNFTDLMNEI